MIIAWNFGSNKTATKLFVVTTNTDTFAHISYTYFCKVMKLLLTTFCLEPPEDVHITQLDVLVASPAHTTTTGAWKNKCNSCTLRIQIIPQKAKLQVFLKIRTNFPNYLACTV